MITNGWFNVEAEAGPCVVNSGDCIICLDKYQEPGLDHLADWQRTVEILLLDPI